MQNTLLLWFITCQSLPLPTRAAQSWEKGFNYVVVSFPQLFRAYVGICRCQMKDIQPVFAGNKDPKNTHPHRQHFGLIFFLSSFICLLSHSLQICLIPLCEKKRKTCMKCHVFILLVFRPFRKKHVTSLQAKRVSRRWLVWIEAVGALYSIFEERGKNESLSSPSKFNSELCDKTEISTRSTASSMKYFIFFPQLHPILNWTKVNACCNFLEKRIKLLGGEVRGCDVSTENSWASLAETTWADGMPRCVCVSVHVCVQ